MRGFFFVSVPNSGRLFLVSS